VDGCETLVGEDEQAADGFMKDVGNGVKVWMLIAGGVPLLCGVGFAVYSFGPKGMSSLPH